MWNKKPRVSKRTSVVIFVSSLLIAVCSTWVLFNKQYVLDQMDVWSYQPSTQVEDIVNKAGITNDGKFVFYATKPEVFDAVNFNRHCPRQETGSPILGCYSGDDVISIYNLSNPKLDGMEEVTAVHELLHALWNRYDDAQKQKLGDWLETAYAKIDDANLKERMDYYQRTEPGEFTNELHSILGSEFPSLGGELETYYSKFFNRVKLLAMHDKYSAIYNDLNNKADSLIAKIKPLEATINSDIKKYNSDITKLGADIDSFNTKARSGGFTSSSAFYSERNSLISRSKQLEVDRSIINANIDSYNQYGSEYQAIADQIKAYNDSLDSYSSLKEVPTV